MNWKRALLGAGVALLAACGGSGFNAATTTTTTTRATSSSVTTTTSGRTTTSSGGATTTSRATTSGSLTVPARIGTLAKIDDPQLEQVAKSINDSLSEQSAITDKVVAFYGTGGQPAYFLVAVKLQGGSGVSSDLILNSLISGIAGSSDLDRASIEDRSNKGVPYKCGKAGQSGQNTAFCSWTSGDVLGVGISIPGSGPSDIDGTFALTTQAEAAVS